MNTVRSIGYISLGPYCLSAEILKAGFLRSCTFGFDWFRSGEYYIRKFLATPSSTDFVDRFVLEPHIPLVQRSIPDSTNQYTVEIAKVQSLYGYDYLYNPHRPLYTEETKAYYYRSFERLRQVVFEPSAFKRFLVADFVNKPFHSFLAEPCEIISSLRRLFESAGVINFDITLLRIRLTDYSSNYRIDKIPSGSPEKLLQGEHHSCNDRIVTIGISRMIDELPMYRSELYRIIGKRLFAKSELPLWKPSINKHRHRP